MSFSINSETLAKTEHDELARYRDSTARFNSDPREVTVDIDNMSKEALLDLMDAAGDNGDKKSVRALKAILAARTGDFSVKVPSHKAFTEMLRNFLAQNLIDGWIYHEGQDGCLYPYLVIDVKYRSAGKQVGMPETPQVLLETVAYTNGSTSRSNAAFGNVRKTFAFDPAAVTNKTVADALLASGIRYETAELKTEYEESLARFEKLIKGGFSQQFRFTGRVYAYEENNYRRKADKMEWRKVIHDIETSDYGAFTPFNDSVLFNGDGEEDGVGRVPEHPLVKVFDLDTHEFYWVHGDGMEPYVYKKDLVNKLVLPDSHRDLLDILTTDLDAFIDDIIEGKSAGNIVLAKGIPGVGKTLTAEIYSEVIEKPLYNVRTGTLGITPDSIEENLKVVLQRANRWGCVLLLDEADVFVMARGADLTQNAVCAVFLRALEYFDGLMFMTTNRSDSIDEAIVSRCAAIIVYDPPQGENCRRVWQVMSTQFNADLSADVIDGLLELFPEIAPRDIKMLLKLAMKVSTAKKQALDLNMFRRCAMFREVAMDEDMAARIKEQAGGVD